MCGITGFYQTERDYTADGQWSARLQQMNRTMSRRGPDGSGQVLLSHTGLAHSRLAVIDLTTGQQPIQRQWQGKSCTIVYNGELYNMTELRQQLQSYPGLSWATTSDTEIVLNGYLAMGTDFFSELNGIFAFAIYDELDDSLILCRDRAGVKPLFYQQTENTLVFGSEPKALFAYGITPKIKWDGWCEVWALGPARTPGHGVFDGMQEVLPGHYLRFQGKQRQDYAYWQLKGQPHSDDYQTTVEKMSWLVEDSICRQMVSDIPVCTFLSGGLDSSLVSAVCAKVLGSRQQQLDTYSFDFVDNDKNFQANAFQGSQDRPYVDRMVQHLHSRHRYLTCTNQIQADYLYKAVDARDVPCMADVESSLLYFCSQVAQEHRVALTGECADEIFGGYPWFHQESALARNHFPWAYDMTIRSALLRDDFLAEIPLAEYAQNAYDQTIAAVPICAEDDPLTARQREISYLNMTWFMATLLNRMDRTSMYSGLEARVPFADYRIIEYAYQIPWSMKCHQGVVKSLLQEAGRSLLPDEVRLRKKCPYPKTYDPAYEQLLRCRLLDVLNTPSSPLLTIIDPVKVRSFLNTPSDYGRPWFGQLMAGPQMLAYLLQMNYWMTKYSLG